MTWRFGGLPGLALVLALAGGPATAAPTSVSLLASFGSEVGCAADFDIGCPQTQLRYRPADDVWGRALTLPPGSFSYVAALNGSFAQTVGRFATPGGANIPLVVPATQVVNFYYDDRTRWLTDSLTSAIAVLAGSFQSELGCASDFDPTCLRSWLQDPDGDGTYRLSVLLPAGNYSTVVAINESFDEVYGRDGVRNGPNFGFSVTSATVPVEFFYDRATHVLSIGGPAPPTTVPEPASWAVLAVGLLALAATRRPRVA